MHLEVRWYFRVNAIQKLAELNRTMSAMQLANDFASGHIQGREQRGRAVALVVVGPPLSLAGSHRQRGLGAVERLDLTLLVGAQHQRSFGRVEIQADNIADLLDQLRISRQLECFGAMRLQSEGFPNPVHALDSGELYSQWLADAVSEWPVRAGQLDGELRHAPMRHRERIHRQDRHNWPGVCQCRPECFGCNS